MNITISHASEKHLENVVEIYNQAIRTGSTIAYIHEFTTGSRRAWFKEHSSDTYPILVAREEDDSVLGWACISPYRKGRTALRKTVLVSYFVHNEHRRKGIGNRLLEEMILKAKALGYEVMIAILFDSNSASTGLLEKHHFEKWGFMPDVAEINGRKFSHLYYGRKL